MIPPNIYVKTGGSFETAPKPDPEQKQPKPGPAVPHDWRNKSKLRKDKRKKH